MATEISTHGHQVLDSSYGLMLVAIDIYMKEVLDLGVIYEDANISILSKS
jgi:hypothetical protein